MREWVLRNTDEEPTATDPLTRPAAHAGHPSVNDMGMTQKEALAQLMLRLPDFQGTPAPATVEELVVQEAFVLPKPMAIDLRRAPRPGGEMHFKRTSMPWPSMPTWRWVRKPSMKLGVRKP